MGNEKETSFQRTRKDPRTKKEACLKEIGTQNRPHCVVLQPPLHKLSFLHLLLLSHLQHQQKKIRIQLETEITNEIFEQIPEISSGYVIFDRYFYKFDY